MSSPASTVPAAGSNSLVSVPALGLPDFVPDDEAVCSQIRLELEELVSRRRSHDTAFWTTVIVSTAQSDRKPGSLRAVSPSAIASPVPAEAAEIAKSNSSTYLTPRRNALRTILLESNVVFQSATEKPVGRLELLASIDAQLLKLFVVRIRCLDDSSDYVLAYQWSELMREYSITGSKPNGLGLLEAALHDIQAEADRSFARSTAEVLTSERLSSLLETCVDRQSDMLRRLLMTGMQLRDKAWYTVDVRTSLAYEGARAVASALGVMGKSKRPSRSRNAPPLRHWSGSKLSSHDLHLKTEAQILGLLSAAPTHGGPNKLKDEQARSTLTWMQQNQIENLCHGEERLHKLCMEVRKCVDDLTRPSAVDNPVFWSSVLYARENLRTTSANKAQMSARSNLAILESGIRRFDSLSLQTNVPRNLDAMSSSSHPLSSSSSRDYFDSRSPTLTTKSSATFWSPAVTEARSPSSATSVDSHMTEAIRPSSQRRADMVYVPGDGPTCTLRGRLTSLLLSDLSASLYHHGSETDLAFSQGLGGDLTKKHFRAQANLLRADTPEAPDLVHEQVPRRMVVHFDVKSAIHRMLDYFTASQDPFKKLSLLSDIQRLLGPYLAEQKARRGIIPVMQSNEVKQTKLAREHQLTPRSDAYVDGFRKIFLSDDMLPAAIFRDLQYIASLVPVEQLEGSQSGKAFWNATIAVLGIKREACKVMVETADSIIAYHSNNRGHGRTPSAAQQQRDSATFSAPSRTPSAEDVARYSMADAAELLQISAKEGDAVAQRELATLYLTHPELMDHIIAPFARPREVFKEELESKWRRNQDPNRCDPATMCVAHHWMSLSATGGDALAKEYLRQREEMERLP